MGNAACANGKADIETDYLNGEIVKLGRLHGVHTPANAAMQKLMTRMIHERMEARRFSLEDIDALISAEG